MSKTVPKFFIPILCFSLLGFIRAPDAEAIPAFAKKYEVSCTLCHTVWPKLTHFGEEFFANGFQLPDTEDGGEIQKIRPDDFIACREKADDQRFIAKKRCSARRGGRGYILGA